MSPSRARLKQHLKFASRKCSGQAVCQNYVESQSLLLSALQEPTAAAGREKQAAGRQQRNLRFDAKSWKFPQICDTRCSLPYHSHRTGQEAALPTRDQGGPGQGWSFVPISRRKAVMFCPNRKQAPELPTQGLAQTAEFCWRLKKPLR